MNRKEFEMTEGQYEKLLDASARAPYLLGNGGVRLTSSVQENANAAWRALGDELGFEWDSVWPVPGKGSRFFSAVALPPKASPTTTGETSMQTGAPTAAPSGQPTPPKRHTKHTSTALAKAGDQEPIFVLRASDKLAPTLVRIWGEMLASAAPKDKFPDQKYADARDVACSMEVWAAEHGSKLPD